MPRKGKRRGAGAEEHDSDSASGSHAALQPGSRSPNEADVNSVASHGSVASGAPADEPSTGAESEDVDDQSADDNFVEYTDKLTAKSLQDRLSALKNLCNAMSSKYMADFLVDRKITIADALDRIIRRGKSEERGLAAKAAALMCTQLGGVDEGDIEIWYTQQLRPAMLVALEDESATYSCRASTAEALGICGFIASEEPQMVNEIMDKCQSLAFKLSHGNDISPELATLCSVALQSWCLLLTITSSASTLAHWTERISLFRKFLESSSVELRIAGGEAMALICELAGELDMDVPCVQDLCTSLRELATDSSKFRAKKDKRQQRSSFRDILKTLEEGEAVSFECKFGTEILYIDSWTRKRQYDAFCSILSSGMNSHLKDNLLLRDVFGLGSPIPIGPSTKMSKNDKRLHNAAIFKARTKARQKFRDKRIANVSD